MSPNNCCYKIKNSPTECINIVVQKLEIDGINNVPDIIRKVLNIYFFNSWSIGFAPTFKLLLAINVTRPIINVITIVEILFIRMKKKKRTHIHHLYTNHYHISTVATIN